MRAGVFSVGTLFFSATFLVVPLEGGIVRAESLSPQPLSLDLGDGTTPTVLADAAAATASGSDSTHEGFLGLLDSRSIYGKDWFPEPLRADESDVDNEVAFSYFHSENHASQSDQVFGEFEKSFGLLTLEIGVGFESDRSISADSMSGMAERDDEQGMTNIELGARYPLLERVSANGMFDNTVVFGLEVSPPTHTPESQDLEIVPKLFDMVKIGNHFSLQVGVGVSTLIGPEGRGLATMEYDTVFGYELTHQVLPIPLVVSATPMFELDGFTTLNQEDAGHDDLTATAGFRMNFEAIGDVEPKLGLGYAFPIDEGGREDLRWGIVSSLIFEY